MNDRKNARKAGQGSNWIHRPTRWAVYHRDGFCCVYCGSKERLSLDHVIACENGGTNDVTNLVTACVSCNSAKQDLTNRAWFAYLRAKGVDTSGLSARISRLTSKALDRVAGKLAWLASKAA